ncbi:HAD family hydrolase [Cryobacterium sp. Y57]|uniref:HAD family hydrolase n=1 Tax=Cryobacterium sp. Y57 TaxID=2048287 RepID=UPI0011B0CD2A|nr:HAD family hydrolase [Cryobacterium sp. Y57]
MHRNSRVLLFDFDGTISLGNGPVARYAECVAESLQPDDRADFLAVVQQQKKIGANSLAIRPIDDYDAVRLAASVFAIPGDYLNRAYLRSRADLAGARAPIEAVPGLAHYLREIRDDAFLVLATNAPATRIREALDALDLHAAFDDVITSVGKPSGLTLVLDRLRTVPSDHAFRLLSLGDVWVNDLEPASLQGFQTALIGSTAPPGATPTYRAERLDELFPVITAWLSHETSGAIVPLPHLET